MPLPHPAEFPSTIGEPAGTRYLHGILRRGEEGAPAGAKDGFAQAGEAIGNAKQGWTDMVAAQNEAQAAQREAFARELAEDHRPDLRQDEVARINAGDGPAAPW